MIYLDTHVVVWLYEKALERLSPRAIELIEGEELLISPLVLLELEYLFEVGKLTEHAQPISQELRARIDLELCPMPLAEVVLAGLHETWTRDPFDRLLTAQARRRLLPLLTKDREIHRHYDRAVW